MRRHAAKRPASARTLDRALDKHGAAPTPDPVLRPDGPKRAGTARLPPGSPCSYPTYACSVTAEADSQAFWKTETTTR
ncbi:hypothetical protein AMK20_19820 [Streptomyces sp. TSRI0261]|nr:hypothetical protein AMK20_19820 [Streptomyces sp. TSRI0261]